jgi:hypothetical protein
MTIDDVMATVVDYRIAVFQGDDAMTASALRTVRNAVKVLVATERDAEAEACAELVMAEQATPHGAAYCEAAIRARIAARKGGAQP